MQLREGVVLEDLQILLLDALREALGRGLSSYIAHVCVLVVNINPNKYS